MELNKITLTYGCDWKKEGFPLLHTSKFSPINIREVIYQLNRSESN